MPHRAPGETLTGAFVSRRNEAHHPTMYGRVERVVVECSVIIEIILCGSFGMSALLTPTYVHVGGPLLYYCIPA